MNDNIYRLRIVTYVSRDRINEMSSTIDKIIKVVHVTTVDSGGAFKAVMRMHQCMNNGEIESSILVRSKNGNAMQVTEVFNSSLQKVISKGKNGLNLLLKRGEIYRNLLGTDISRYSLIQEADVIFLHWINSFLSYQSIKELYKLQKPIVWVMHDMWLFTGGCHYDILPDCFCGRYELGCGFCPLAGSYRDNDISKKNYLDKQKLFKSYPFMVTGPSNWIVECAKKSHIFSIQNIQCLPNCYDQSIFYEREDTRSLCEKYNIHTSKKIVLFGSARSTQDNENKGIKYLIDALQKMPINEYFLLVFGTTDSTIFTDMRFDYQLLGYVQNENEMAEIYSIADVYVSPSRQESFGYTVCEAMACGAPVVAFEVGGIKDQIIHKENGYMAKERDVEDLARGIEYCINHSSKLEEMAKLSAHRFSYSSMQPIYTEFVKDILNSTTI